jgi:hypothetical protein
MGFTACVCKHDNIIINQTCYEGVTEGVARERRRIIVLIQVHCSQENNHYSTNRVKGSAWLAVKIT